MSGMSNWLKAGLIGAAMAVALSLVNVIIPDCACFTWFPGLLAYGIIGALAVYWMPSGRTPGPAARNGALAAVIASAIGGAVGGVIFVVQMATTVYDPAFVQTFVQTLSQTPEALEQFEAAGIDPASAPGLMMAATAVYAMVSYGIWLAVAAGIGAAGGAIFAYMNPKGPAQRYIDESIERSAEE